MFFVLSEVSQRILKCRVHSKPLQCTVDQNTSIAKVGSSLSFVPISCHCFVFDLHHFFSQYVLIFPINPRGALGPDWTPVIPVTIYLSSGIILRPHWSGGRPLPGLSLVIVSCSFNSKVVVKFVPFSVLRSQLLP